MAAMRSCHAVGLVELVAFTRERHRLSFTFEIDGSPFSTSVWYGDVDLVALEERYGLEALRKIYFHIMAFVAVQYVSLAPARLAFGEFATYADGAFAKLWRTVFAGVFAQWRYENDLPAYAGPVIEIARTSTPGTRVASGGRTLLFSGGGKDSAVAQGLLARSGIAYDSICYSHSIYGRAHLQHERVERVIAHGRALRHHRVSVFDEFLDSPILARRPEYGVETLCAAETPSMLFITLPLVLAYGYSRIAMGHERSADYGNLVWEKTGEDVNHQWGKSLDAELALGRYVDAHVVSGLHFFSVLKPFNDVAIFTLGADDLPAIASAHSCNVDKPWCMRCAKCAYVWLNCKAFFPPDFGGARFEENLFDVPENRLWFRQLLGLEAHTPFECVGQPNEARLAFALCRLKGFEGIAMRDFSDADFDVDYAALYAEYATGDDTRTGNIPPDLWSIVGPAAYDRLARRRAELLPLFERIASPKATQTA